MKFQIEKGVTLNRAALNRYLLEFAACGNSAAVETLVRAGADIHTQTKDAFRHTALHLAALFGHAETAKALIAMGAGPNAQDNNGWTALHLAARGGQTATARILIARGASLSAKAINDWTPLHCAAIDGHTAAAEALIAKGASLDAQDNDGFTALHLAARYGHTGTGLALISRGAGLDVRDKNGRTPLNYLGGVAAAVPLGAWDAALGARETFPLRPEQRAVHRGGRRKRQAAAALAA